MPMKAARSMRCIRYVCLGFLLERSTDASSSVKQSYDIPFSRQTNANPTGNAFGELGETIPAEDHIDDGKFE